MRRLALGGIADLQAGVVFPPDLQGRATGDYPVAKVGDISRCGRSSESVLRWTNHYVDSIDLVRLRAKIIPEGSTLFAKIGEAIRGNHRVVAGCNMLIDNNAMAAIPGPEVFGRYLYHFLRTIDFYSIASATTVPALRKSDLARVEIPIPSLMEQQRIAKILDAAEALRVERRAALATLDELENANFQEMFGGAGERSGWPIRRLGEIATTTSGGTPDRAEPSYYGGDIPWVKSGELHHGLVLHTEEQLTKAGVASSSAKVVPSGTILMAMYGATGGVVARLGVDAATNQAICCIRVSAELNPDYLVAFLKRAMPTLLLRRVGGAQPNLSQELIRNLEVSVPPLSLQVAFAKRVETVRRHRDVQRSSLAELDALFASLQHRAFRGEL